MANLNASDNNLSGFYYDLQLASPFTKCSLHANRKTNDGGLTWEDDKEDEGYSKAALCESILTEDFNISIANNWSDFGGDPIGELWNTVKPLAPYATKVIAGLDEMVRQQESLTEDQRAKVNNSKAAKALGSIVKKIRDLSTHDAQGNDLNAGRKEGDPLKISNSAIVDYLNRSLVVQGTRFSYYNGTGVSFGNLSMKFTVFPKWDGTTFMTVNHQISQLYPYLVGKFVKEENLPADIKDFVGWQKPPGGFVADLKNVDNVQPGTLKLKLGAYYSLTNLVCQDATFNFSKQMVKNPKEQAKDCLDGIVNESLSIKLGDQPVTIPLALPSGLSGPGSNNTFSPLYCDVIITLRPATKYSDDKLKEFATGQGRQKDIESINNQMKERLNNRIKELKNAYKK